MRGASAHGSALALGRLRHGRDCAVDCSSRGSGADALRVGGVGSTVDPAGAAGRGVIPAGATDRGAIEGATGIRVVPRRASSVRSVGLVEDAVGGVEVSLLALLEAAGVVFLAVHVAVGPGLVLGVPSDFPVIVTELVPE